MAQNNSQCAQYEEQVDNSAKHTAPSPLQGPIDGAGISRTQGKIKKENKYVLLWFLGNMESLKSKAAVTKQTNKQHKKKTKNKNN